MKRSRVLLADDHRIVADGLRAVLEPEFDLVETVEDGRTLIDAARRLKPDVIVVDVSMPLLNGIEATRVLKKESPGVKVVFLTMHPDVTYATSAFEAGASGYVLKHSAASELLKAIREVLRGRTYMTPLISDETMAPLMEGPHRPRKFRIELTTRQREVLQLVAEGRSAKGISNILSISPRTVEFHKQRMMDDLNLHSNAELVHYAIRHGITPA